MKKRILSIMLTICIVFMVVPISVNAMSLNVNLSIIGKENLTLNVESGDSIENVKEKIKTETELPVTDQILKYEGKVLEDGRTLADYNIQKESTIELSLAESIPEGLEYTISDAGEVTITKYTGSATTVNIPEKIVGKNVTSIGYAAFRDCTSLTSINIPSSVTSIGDEAFYGCTSLASITIPSSVTSIGIYAFYGCTGLKTVSIPGSITSISRKAFSDCTGLTSVDIQNGVTSIGESSFSGCTNLINITLANSVKFIGMAGLLGCDSLTSLTLPVNFETISMSALYCCNSLAVVFAPASSDVGMSKMPETTTQVRYSFSDDTITITEIKLGNDKTSVDIPDMISGYPVVAVAGEYQSLVSSHTCAGDTATCLNPKTCSICGKTFNPHSYTKEDKNIAGALKTAGTCTSEAVYYYSCKFCGKVERDDNHTFKGEKDSNKHIGENVWTKTETQHEQKWNCCEITTVSLEKHQWENGVCTECDYICVHKNENTDHLCDICGATLSECKDENTDHKCDICGVTLSECNDKKQRPQM